MVIYLHRALVKQRLAVRWVIKDLAGLWFSAMDAGLTQRDLLRFMRAYRGEKLRTILAGELSFWRAVQQRALRLYRRHQH